MTLFCLVIAWSLSISIFTSIVIYCINGFRHIHRLHSIPCNKCQYFTDSYYLKCTVNPEWACSEAAIDCRDYLAQSQPTQQKLVRKQVFVHHL
jgi:hypothetical protein